jgi:hypothetical protein
MWSCITILKLFFNYPGLQPRTHQNTLLCFLFHFLLVLSQFQAMWMQSYLPSLNSFLGLHLRKSAGPHSLSTFHFFSYLAIFLIMEWISLLPITFPLLVGLHVRKSAFLPTLNHISNFNAGIVTLSRRLFHKHLCPQPRNSATLCYTLSISHTSFYTSILNTFRPSYHHITISRQINYPFHIIRHS